MEEKSYPVQQSEGAPYPQQQQQPQQPMPQGQQPQPGASGAPPPVQPGYVYVQTSTAYTPPYSSSNQFENFPGKQYFPRFNMCLAVTFMVLNCIIPGIGTLLASVMLFLPEPICKVDGGCGKKCACFAIHFFAALGQLITLVLIIGYIWAIMWGYVFIFVSAQDLMLKNQPVVTEHVVLPPPPPGVNPLPPPATASDRPPTYTESSHLVVK